MDFEEIFAEYGTAIIATGLNLVLALLNFLYTKISKKKIKADLQALQDADLTGIYSRCPVCGSEIELEGLALYRKLTNGKEIYAEADQKQKEE